MGSSGELLLDVPVKHPADLVWKTYVHELETCLPTVMPGHFHGAGHENGPAVTPGSVLTLTYGPDVSHYEEVKLRWDEVDHENHTFKCTLVGGGALGKHFGHLAYNFSILPGEDANSCVMHYTVEYEDIEEHNFHDFIKKELETFCINLEAHLSSE